MRYRYFNDANEEMLACNADASNSDADPDTILDLNTGYADTDADLYINIMSLCLSNNNYERKN